MPNPLVPMADRQQRMLYTDAKGSKLVMYSDELLGTSGPMKLLQPGRLTDAQRAARTDLLAIVGAQITSIDSGITYESDGTNWIEVAQVAKAVPVTAGQVASPTAGLLADKSAIYRLDVSPFTRYVSNGTALVELGSAGGGGAASNVFVPQVAAVTEATGKQIGLPGNLFEALGTDGPIPNAILPTAPLPTPLANTLADLGAYWYNDFGLEYTRASSPTTWMGWYDWRWNFRSTDGLAAQAWSSGSNYSVGTTVRGTDGVAYIAIAASTSASPQDPAGGASPTYWEVRPEIKHYPDRMPLLGWYRGDDPRVISWQIKWAVEHGITWAVLQQRARLPDDGGNWTTPGNVAHWVYRVSEDKAVKAGLFKLAFWLPHSASEYGIFTPINGEWNSTTAYTPGMRVATFSGGAATFYRCILSHTNQPVSNTTYWLPIPQWNNTTPYALGDIVYNNGYFYINISAGAGPATSVTSSWQNIAVFNTNANVTYQTGMVVHANTGDNRHYVANTSGSGTALGAPSGSNTNWTRREMPAAWKPFVDWHVARPNSVKTITKNSKTYLAVFLWDQEVMRSQAQTNGFIDYMKQLGVYIKAQYPAWDGVALLSRRSTSPSTDGGALNYETLELDGNVLMLRTEYPGHEVSTGATNYSEIVSAFPTFLNSAGAARQNKRVYNPVSSLQTVSPHDSRYKYAGHTPALFGALVKKMREYAAAGNGFVTGENKPLLLAYNMGEWAEAGPALQPNMQDGFGYLTELKKAIT